MNRYILIILLFASTSIQAQNTELWSMTLGGSDGLGALIKTDANGDNFEVTYKFKGCSVSDVIGNLLEISPGEFIGVSSNGANLKKGSIFRYNKQKEGCEVLFDFPQQIVYSRPGGYLVKHGNGNVYGTTNRGGNLQLGSIFEFDPNNDSTKIIFHCDSHLSGLMISRGLTIGPGGDLYGMLRVFQGSHKGKLFRYNPNTKNLTFLDTLDASEGYGSEFLTYASNGRLYGTTTSGGANNKGVLFEFDPISNTTKVLHNFNGTDGDSFKGMMVEGDSNRLFGMTYMGGSANKGVLYEYNLNTDSFTVRQHFTGSLNGAEPEYFSLLKANNNKVYGMTGAGGSGDKGLLFCYNPSSNNYNVLYNFSLSQATIGTGPEGGLIQGSDQAIYGMVNKSGINTNGAIFRYDIIGDSIDLKQAFNVYENGAFPLGQLLMHSNGNFYGGLEAPYNKNDNSYGGIFSFDPVSKNYQLIHTVDEESGFKPNGYQAELDNGKIYGIMQNGGADMTLNGGCGLIYSFDPTTNTYVVEEDFFKNIHGCGSQGSLLKASNGLLYGTTFFAGNGGNGKGALFSFDPKNKNFQVILNFSDSTGYMQYGKMWQLPNGKIYGTMLAGAEFGQGCIFELDPSTNTFESIYDFNSSSNQGIPIGGLTPTEGNQYFYGLTSVGIYKFDLINKQYSIEFTGFIDTVGSISGTPAGGLIRASNGKFYGHSNLGAKNDFGNFFEFDPVSKQVTVKHEYDTRALKPRNTMWVEINGDPIGVTEYKNEFQLFRLHPNPANNQLTISLNEDYANGRLLLFDSQGVKVKDLGTITKHKKVDVSGLDTGVYFIRLQIENSFSTLKFIKSE